MRDHQICIVEIDGCERRPHPRVLVLRARELIDATVGRIVRDRVDGTPDLHRAHDLERDWVDLAHGVVVAVAGKDVAVRRIDRDAVHRPGAHLSDDGAGVGVDDEQRARAAVRGVDAAPLRVDRHVVETAEDGDCLRR